MNNDAKILSMLEGLTVAVTQMQGDISGLKDDVSGLKQGQSKLEAGQELVKQEVSAITEEIVAIREDMTQIRHDVTLIEHNHGEQLKGVWEGYGVVKDKLAEHTIILNSIDGKVDNLSLRVHAHDTSIQEIYSRKRA